MGDRAWGDGRTGRTCVCTWSCHLPPHPIRSALGSRLWESGLPAVRTVRDTCCWHLHGCISIALVCRYVPEIVTASPCCLLVRPVGSATAQLHYWTRCCVRALIRFRSFWPAVPWSSSSLAATGIEARRRVSPRTTVVRRRCHPCKPAHHRVARHPPHGAIGVRPRDVSSFVACCICRG